MLSTRQPRPTHRLGLQLGRLSLLLGFLSLQGAMAQPTDGQRPPLPPAQALAACKSLASGKACSFSTDKGTVSGSCFAPEGMPLACRPKDGPPPPPSDGKTPPAKR